MTLGNTLFCQQVKWKQAAGTSASMSLYIGGQTHIPPNLFYKTMMISLWDLVGVTNLPGWTQFIFYIGLLS